MRIIPALGAALVAVMLSGQAYAQGYNDSTAGQGAGAAQATDPGQLPPRTEPNDTAITRDIKEGLREANQELRETAQEIRAFFMDEANDGFNPILIRREVTAQGMIGEKVRTPEGNDIAEIKDIILERDGTASKVIVSDGGMLGIGNKLAAFDFDRVITRTEDGKIVMSLSQDMIDRAGEFSYDQNDYRNAEIMPADNISVRDLLDGEVFDYTDNKVATIDNISIVDNEADKLLVSFNKVLGLGGDVAALNFDSLQFFERNRSEVNVRLTEAQTRQFRNFKKYAEK